MLSEAQKKALNSVKSLIHNACEQVGVPQPDMGICPPEIVVAVWPLPAPDADRVAFVRLMVRPPVAPNDPGGVEMVFRTAIAIGEFRIEEGGPQIINLTGEVTKEAVTVAIVSMAKLYPATKTKAPRRARK